MSDNRAQIEITASTRRLSAGLSQARRMLGGFASAASRGVAGSFSKLKLGDVGKNALGHFGGSMLSRGFDAVIDTAQGVRDFERSLIRYQIATDGSAASTARMREQVRAVSRETGVAADQVLAGAAQYVALTGDANGAARAMQFFADTSVATGSSVDDVAKAAASLGMTMGITSDQFEAAFSGLVAQGKAGAVELSNLASEMPEVLSQFSAFKGAKSIAGIREMGAAFQVIRKNATSASSASTQFSALMGELADTEVLRKLNKIGVAVYDANGQMRSASDIFEDLAKNQKLMDPRIVAAIFRRKEAQQAVRSIRDNIEAYRDLRRVAEDTGVIQRDKMAYLKSDAGKIDTAFNNMKLSIAEAFTPERIHAFTQALTKVGDWMSKIVGYMEKVADYADHLRKAAGIKTVDERVDEIYNKTSTFKAPMSPQAKLAHAQKLRQEAANIYTKPGGYSEDEEVNMRVKQRVADDLVRRADEELYGKGPSLDMEKFKHRYAMAAPDRFEKYDAQFAEPILKAVLTELKTLNRSTRDVGDAVRAAGKTTVKVGSDTIVKAYDESIEHLRNTRP